MDKNAILRDESFPAYPHSGTCGNCGRDRDDLFYHRQDDAFYCCDVFRCEVRLMAISSRSPRTGDGGTT